MKIRRFDYVSLKGMENRPIEQAMTIFVKWAKATDRSHHAGIVKENLQRYLREGATPAHAVQRLRARVRR